MFGRRRGEPGLPVAQTTDALFGARRREPELPRAPATDGGFTVVRAAGGRTVAVRRGDVAAVAMEGTPDGEWTLAIVLRGGGEARVALPDEEAARAVLRELTGNA